MLLGALTRALCVVNDSIWTIIVGGFLCSCCNAFFINVQPIIVNKWFTDKERALATAIQTIGMPLGSALGYGCAAAWFKDVSIDNFDPDAFMILFNNLMAI